MKQSLQVIENYQFGDEDFVGGEAALDFVNTVSGRDESAPRDRLDSYERLLDWAAHANLLPGKRLRALARHAQSDRAPRPGRSKAQSGCARRCLPSSRRSRPVAARRPRRSISCARTGSPARRRRSFTSTGADSRWASPAEDDDLDLIAAIIAWRMVGEVLPISEGRLRICQGPDCAWTFIDRSKAGRRRWCDMAVCGNAAKSRRHYARTRAKS